MGRIVLVGAGPGDPDLITLAGRDAIADADVVVYDRLASPRLLRWAKAEAQLIFAGKRAGEPGPLTQDEINDLLCTEARAGRMVVRLKGGDPFVFGRGGEEALAAATAGIPYTVIPGVTAAVAVPAAAGIPVTHRGLATSFTVVTGQAEQGADEINWEALARVGGTLVLLMAVETLPLATSGLLAAGLAPATAAAVIEAGTLPEQRVILGDLANIAARARQAGIASPATTVIGAVAALAAQIQIA